MDKEMSVLTDFAVGIQLRNNGFRVKPGMTIKLKGLLKQHDSIGLILIHESPISSH